VVIFVSDRSGAWHAPLRVVVCDVLELEGERTLSLPYPERRRLLEGAALAGRGWFTPETFTDHAPADARAHDGAPLTSLPGRAVLVGTAIGET
jgi:hypothetical protein